MIELRMACGHPMKVAESETTAPICACGERRVSRVKARAPKFRGICQGPHATYADLSATTVAMPKDSNG